MLSWRLVHVRFESTAFAGIGNYIYKINISWRIVSSDGDIHLRDSIYRKTN